MSDLVEIHADRVDNTHSTAFPGHSAVPGQAWTIEHFADNLKVDVRSVGERSCQFDLVGIDTSVANAFRRIMISEVPSVAAEYVYVFNNTSVIQDEVLAHRIGLVPLKVDPDQLTWIDKQAEEKDKFTDENTIVLSLDVVCTHNPNAESGNSDPENLYRNSKVYARDLKFEPQGKQAELFANNPIVPCDPDILLAKLRPGQEISVRVHCVLGIGADHAKFSPVSTASYRLLPVIDILEPIVGQDAQQFKKCFPKGVVGINDKGEAYIKDARKDTVSREVLRHENLAPKVKLGRRKDHFMFSVESTGAMPAEEIFFKSVRILKNKAEFLKNSPIGNSK